MKFEKAPGKVLTIYRAVGDRPRRGQAYAYTISKVWDGRWDVSAKTVLSAKSNPSLRPQPRRWEANFPTLAEAKAAAQQHEADRHS